ncbi:MAG TPA: UDP-3-O-(3-hydroxymyristoyl)glucosamine N-acyltransferase [Clostridia bacterium]|nr:UDP-3-O-(3-hydroxymyristoyl)glucosamine N-acyltransferase [Clostridia bacterium]
MKLSEIASAIGARIENTTGDVEISGVAGIEEAAPGQITFVANPKYASAAQTTRASAIIVSEDFPALNLPVLRSKNPYLSFAHAVEQFYCAPKYAPGVHPTAVIHANARVGRNASIGAYVVVDDGVVIGDDCVLLPHVVIYRGAQIGDRFFAHAHAIVREYCRIGNDVILQNNVIIGADGFGFARDEKGWYKIVQSGVVVIEDGVEVQGNSCVDRASIGQTTVARGAKIDTLVQVGHGCTVGENTMLCSQVGLAGSTRVGKNVILAGQVGVAGHLTIGDGAIATAQSGIPGDVAPNTVVSGYPAIENRQWLRSVAVFNKLPELAKAVRRAGKKTEE